MYKKTFFIVLTVTVHCFLFSVVFAGGVGTTGAQFLKLGIGAKPSGMGESFVGIADDVNSIFWNPAGLTNLKSFETSLSGVLLYQGIYYGSIGVGKNISKSSSLGIGMIYLGMDKIKGYDKWGNSNPEGDYTANDRAVSVSYGQKISSKVSIGICIKTIQQIIEKVSATGTAYDIGMLYSLNKFSMGIVGQNMGSSIGFYEKFSLPTIFKLGISYRIKKNFLIGSDVNFPVEYKVNFHLGMEYVYKNILSLRLGLKTNTIDDLGSLSGLTSGFGLRLGKMDIDYASLTYGDLGNTSKIGLSFKF